MAAEPRIVGGMNFSGAGDSLHSPLLRTDKERIATLQRQVTFLDSNLRDMERKVGSLEAQDRGAVKCNSSLLESDSDQESMQHMPSSKVERKVLPSVLSLAMWKLEHIEHARQTDRLTRPDENLFFDVTTAVFSRYLPNWTDVSVDHDGMLDLHCGPASRTVPFLAMIFAGPAALLLPAIAVQMAVVMCRAPSRHSLRGCLRASVMGWFAWVPLLYMAFGDLRGDFRRHEVSILTLIFPWWAIMYIGYTIVNQRLLDACDQAVEESKRKAMKGKCNNRAVTSILKALADPTDTFSLYPMFTLSENDEPEQVSLNLFGKLPILLITLTEVTFALYPCFEQTCGVWPWIFNTTAAAAIGFASYFFCHDLALSLSDFRDCVDEVAAFLFLCSPPEVRMSRRLQDSQLDRMKDNAAFREHLVGADPDTEDGVQVIAGPPAGRRSLEGVWVEWQRAADSKVLGLPLEARRFELDLSTGEGVVLFRQLQRFISVDVVNERFGIDTSANILLVMIPTLLAIALLPVLLSGHTIYRVSLMQMVVLFNVIMMLGYIILCCNYCIDMNDLIFKFTDKLLLQWKDHARDPSQVYARAWVDGAPKDFTAASKGPRSEIAVLEVREMIQVTRERLDLQEPQRIMGMTVTSTLRARLLSTFGGAIAAVSVSVIKKHFGDES